MGSDDGSRPRAVRGQEISEEHWIILLVEFVHLLGLFLIHTRHAKSARATAVLFDQLIRHLNILSKLPDNDGAMIIRKVRERDTIALPPPNYLVLFGNLVLQGDAVLEQHRRTSHRMSPFGSALRQAFGCMIEQGIHALYLEIPDESTVEIDRFRLALNILARFQLSDRRAGQMTFRYFGRSITVPLIRNRHGQADPNLTLLAGLNGLSVANTLELIKQVEAYGKLTMPEATGHGSVNWFNRIFSEPRISRDLIRPPLEVNNLAWSDIRIAAASDSDGDEDLNQRPSGAIHEQEVSPKAFRLSEGETGIQAKGLQKTGIAHIDRASLIKGLNPCPPGALEAVSLVFQEDYSLISVRQFGQHLAAISLILDLLEQNNDDGEMIEAFLFFLNSRLEWISDSVWLSIHTQREGITIRSGESAILIGMVNHRLFDLISLIKERLLTRLKIEAVQALTFGFKQEEARRLAERFGVSPEDASRIIVLLQTCFDEEGRFNRKAFEARVHRMAPYHTPIFEMLWCLFKRTANREERLDFLNAIQLLMDRLDDGKDALQFLLSDIFQNPFEVKHMDRNAMVLANILLRTYNQDLGVDRMETPEGVLNTQHGLDRSIQQYVTWRLEFDQARIMTKLRTIGDLLHRPPDGDDDGSSLLLDQAFLAALEREILIFFALVGGKTARLILRLALSRYALLLEDDTRIHGRRQMQPSLIMDRLDLIVHGLGRIGREKDVEILKQFKESIGKQEAAPAVRLITNRISGLKDRITQALKAIQNG